MKTVNLIGHLIVDKVFTGFDSIDTLGGIANVWSSLLKLDQHVNVNVLPCALGEALIVVDTNTNKRVGRAILNYKETIPNLPQSNWSHIAYINQIKNLDFLNDLTSTISADKTKESPELCLPYLNKLDYLFLSKEDLFDDIKTIGKEVKNWVIAHDPFGSVYSNGEEIFEYKLPKNKYLNNINVLGAGDAFAAAFINEKIYNSKDIHSVIKNSHLKTTKLIQNK